MGDFVKFDANGRLIRSPSGGAGVGVSEYRGLVVAPVPNSREHPAFSAPFNRPLVALLVPNRTELLMRQINNNGNYVVPTLKPNDPTVFIFNSTTKRWGVQRAQSGWTPTGRVVKVLSDGRLLILFGNF
jgi:protein-L-isoaspartate O-methyltransferase